MTIKISYAKAQECVCNHFFLTLMTACCRENHQSDFMCIEDMFVMPSVLRTINLHVHI